MAHPLTGDTPFIPQTPHQLPLSPQQRTISKVKSQLYCTGAPSDSLKKSSSCVTLHEAFNQSLITRIREVHRLNPQDLKSAFKTDEQWPVKLSKSRAGLREQLRSGREGREGTGEGCGEAGELRAALGEQKRRNQQLSLQIEQYQCRMFALGQQVEQLQEELQEKEGLLLRAQQQLEMKQEEDLEDYEELLKNHDKLVLKCQQLQEQLILKDQLISINAKAFPAAALKIVAVLSERVITVPSLDKLALLKAGAEMASLKKHHETVLRQRDAETEQLRRKFVRNLNHYKDIIIKFTSKADGKARESLLESTFTENSSNEDII